MLLLEDVKMSGNWMWAAKCEGEGARLVHACDALCEVSRQSLANPMDSACFVEDHVQGSSTSSILYLRCMSLIWSTWRHENACTIHSLWEHRPNTF